MLKTAKVVGLNSDNEAALTLTSSRETLSRPLFLAVVLCSAEDAFSKVRQCLAETENEFFSSEDSLSARLAGVAVFIKEYLKDAEKLEVILAAVDEDESGAVLYLLQSGEGLTASLYRDEKQTDLGKVSGGEVVSGVLQPGDRVVLATQSLLDFLGKDLSRLYTLPIETLEDEVLARLPEAEVCPMAAIALEKEKSVVEKDTSIPEIVARQSLSLPALNLKKWIGLGIKLVPQTKKGRALLLGTVFIFVLAGVVWGYQKRQAGQQQKNLTGSLSQITEDISQANLLKATDPQQAMNKLSEAEGKLSQVLQAYPQDESALGLQKQIIETKPGIFQIYEVNNLPVWLELGLIKPDFSGDRLSLSLGKLLFLDKYKKMAVTVTVESKSLQVLAGEDKLGEGSLASLNGDTAWVYSADKGMVRVSGEEIKVMIEADKEWGSVVDVYGFAGNLYVLDLGQIWKYVPIATGYADKRGYFKNEANIDLSGSKRMQIDGSIWILKESGEILRYTQGEPDYFSFAGLDRPVKKPQSFFVSDQTDNVYILDGENNRLLVVDKKGVYKAQYLSDRFKEFMDLAVDEKGKKVYLLDGKKIYLLELR